MHAPLLELRNVEKSVGMLRLLKGLSLQAHSGEIVCLYGARGVGKKKLLELILGLDAPDAGEILLEGRSLSGMSPKARVGLGVSSALLPDPLAWRLADAVAEPSVGARLVRRAKARGVRPARARRILAAQAFEAVAMPSEYLQRRFSEMSAGMRTRVEIAELMVATPKLILLDEPYKQFDAFTVEAFERLLRDLTTRLNACVLLSDRSGEGASGADRVYRLDGGIAQETADLPGKLAETATAGAGPPLRRVFISYARADSAAARRIVDALNASGVETWMDQTHLETGAPWDQAIEAGLKRSSHFLVALSEAAAESQSVLDEISYAVDARKIIIPVRIGFGSVPLRIRRRQYFDMTGNFDEKLTELVDLVRAEGF